MKLIENVLSLIDVDEIRLQLFLSRNGKWSRRKAAEIIESGSVTVNNESIIQPFFRVSNKDLVCVNGEQIKVREERETWLLNKPREVICSSFDPQGRKLAISFIPGWEDKRLFNIGRLDYQSIGMILLTNDGNLADSISHPSNEIVKEYLVKTNSIIDEKILKKFEKGFSINGINYKIRKYEIVDSKCVRLCLNEGKNREIRRFFQYHDLSINLLKRIRIGNLKIDSLKSGEFRKLNKKDIDLLIR